MTAPDEFHVQGLLVKRGRNMKIINCVFLMTIAFICIVGCSEKYGEVKKQSESDAKATEKELLNNWTEYNIYINRFPSVVRLKGPSGTGAIVFDPKKDDREILLRGKWDTVKDQKAWAQMVKANTTSEGHFDISAFGSTDLGYSTRIREIWGPDKQLYGFIISRDRSEAVVSKVDEKSIRLGWSAGGYSGAP